MSLRAQRAAREEERSQDFVDSIWTLVRGMKSIRCVPGSGQGYTATFLDAVEAHIKKEHLSPPFDVGHRFGTINV